MCCAVSIFVWNYLCGFSTEMDVFSLKEDDCGGLFLTQQSNGNVQEVKKDEESDMEVSFLGVRNDDFQSPCVLLVTKQVASCAEYFIIFNGKFMFKNINCSFSGETEPMEAHGLGVGKARQNKGRGLTRLFG